MSRDKILQLLMAVQADRSNARVDILSLTVLMDDRQMCAHLLSHARRLDRTRLMDLAATARLLSGCAA